METIATHTDGVPFLRETLVFLVSAVVIVLALHRLRLSPLLGYLLAGVLVGPFGLGVIPEVAEVRAFAELGVVFLLFNVGLELSFERLQTMRSLVFGLGAAQVAASTAVIGGIAYLFGNSPATAIVLGAALALSSTAVVVQLLIERGEIASRTGRATFSVLLFQDLAVVPLLVLVEVLARGGEEPIAGMLASSLLKAFTAIAIIVLVGRYALRPPLRWVSATRSTELFVAMTLIIVLATAWATYRAGLSLELGAFLAGLMLAGTEFRHQVDADIKPFRGLLLGLFFMTVGMGIDLHAVAGALPMIVASVAGLIVVKTAIHGLLCRAFGLPLAVAVRSGLLLGEGGEFAFVVIGAAAAAGLMPHDLAQFMLVVTGLSIMTTPLLAAAGAWAARAIERAEEQRRLAGAERGVSGLEAHVVIAGFGRVGQTVAGLLEQQGVPYVALDLDTRKVRTCRREGKPVFYGDGSNREVLARVGADRAAVLVATIDDPMAVRRAVAAVSQHWPQLKVFARAHDSMDMAELRRLGAAGVVLEMLDPSLALASQALRATGAPNEAIAALIEGARGEGAPAEEKGRKPPREKAG